jgi:hypothetical protein
MTNTNVQVELTIIDISGSRFEKGNLGTLENAYRQAVSKWGIDGIQISYDEIKEGLFYAQITEFRNGEHYNDIYLK